MGKLAALRNIPRRSSLPACRWAASPWPPWQPPASQPGGSDPTGAAAPCRSAAAWQALGLAPQRSRGWALKTPLCPRANILKLEQFRNLGLFLKVELWQFKSTQDSDLLHALVVFEACYSHIVLSMGGCGQIQLCSWLCQLPYSLPCCKGRGGKMSRQDLGFVSRVGYSRYRPLSCSSLPELVSEDEDNVPRFTSSYLIVIWRQWRTGISLHRKVCRRVSCTLWCCSTWFRLPLPKLCLFFFFFVRTRIIKECFTLRLFCRKSGALVFW